MNFMMSQIQFLFQNRRAKTNVRRLLKFLAGIILLITVYTILFHVIMEFEGQDHSWFSGFYWTLVVMSTLGFGDITFSSDLGRLFSVFVLMSGVIVLLVMLPFTFIQFFYAPWLESLNKTRTPKELSSDTSDHVIITNYDAVTAALITKLTNYQYDYVLLVSDMQKALAYYDLGLKVMIGEIDDPATWEKARVKKASLVVAAAGDMLNTNVTFTVRDFSEDLPIVSFVNSNDSIDILKLAGASHVLQLGVMMGQSLARRTVGGSSRVHVIGHIDQLVIGEALASDTPLVGKTLIESKLREKIGVNVIGIWERGKFINPTPNTIINKFSILVLAGSVQQLRSYDEYFGIFNVGQGHVIILGGGRSGRATSKSLNDRQMDNCIVEKLPERIRTMGKYVIGDAADLDVLEKAGIREAHTVIVTTHDDDTNIYLTLYCRKLRPDIQINARATLERNINTLHRAGADVVMSYASMGANAVFNILERDEVLMIAEGLNVFRVDLPSNLIGKSILDCGIRQSTGCSIVAIHKGGEMIINPNPSTILDAGMEIVLIGDYVSEKKFIEQNS